MNNKKIPTSVGTIVLIIIALTVFGVVWGWERGQSGMEKTQPASNVIKNISQKNPVPNQQEQIIKQQEDLASRENISFCGKIYKSEKVIINNVNIAESIAKISNEKNWMCKNLELGKFQESGIGIFQKKEESKNNSYLIVFFHPNDQKEKDDPLNQSPDIFRFDFNNNSVYYQDQFTGNFKIFGYIK